MRQRFKRSNDPNSVLYRGIMLNVRQEILDAIPVLSLTGRLDSYGASILDEQIALVNADIRDLVLDFTSVEYLSSVGVRSLLKVQKTLSASSGGVILVGLSPFVRQVLELAGLLEQFRVFISLEEALGAAKRTSAAHHVRTDHVVNGHHYTVRTISAEQTTLELWGSIPVTADKVCVAENLVAVSLGELGPAIGIGGFGQNRTQAAEALGEFVAAGCLAGVIPADGQCISDFILTDAPAEAIVYVASAMGLAGKPVLLVEGDQETALSIAELINEIFPIVTELRGKRPPVLGFVLLGEPAEIAGSYFRDLHHINTAHPERGHTANAKGALILGVTTDLPFLRSSAGGVPPGFLEEMGRYPLGSDLLFHAHGVTLTAMHADALCGVMEEDIRRIAELTLLGDVVHIEPETTIQNWKIWIYLPERVTWGVEKRLTIELQDKGDFPEEWEVVTRRIYADAGRVVLTPIHGGFMAKTFHVSSYGADGRRMIPTVLKIGSPEVMLREERAYRDYVEHYILNNSTIIMGTASYGNWAGLRYNFVGISGPDSRLSWLTDHYRTRPVREITPIVNNLFTNILKPWYGQPRWEEIHPYVDHDPRRLFPSLLDEVAKVLGVSAEEETLHCAELDLVLPNPFHFLKYFYPQRKRYSRLWYTGITHGDLNMQNILLDEHENIYVIDFSETRSRNIVSDFARLEAIVKIEMTRLNDEADLRALLEFEMALTDMSLLTETPPCNYRGSDTMVAKAHSIICLLRDYANRVTIFETDITPYLLALLEWTYPVVCYSTASFLAKRFAALSAGMMVRKILELETSAPALLQGGDVNP
jgi:anti-anti-sigma factor